MLSKCWYLKMKYLSAAKIKVHKGMVKYTNILPHLWESMALWNRFWRLALKVEVGRKDHLPHLLATISVGIKRNRFSFTETRRCAALAHCLIVHLLQLNHYQTKRNYRKEQSTLE